MRLALLYLLPTMAFSQTATEKLLLEKIASLEARLAALEARSSASPAPNAAPAIAATATTAPPPAALPASSTFNLTLDGYYAYNFNRPTTGTNELRAYDGSHNSFSLNQATMVLERTTSLDDKRYLGGRLDLQFGQATQTLQGNPLNEPRPAIYRHIFQAYGSILAPIGKGLSVDMGKFASALGMEGNYTKDQINYSRSYFFVFLPFYHMGFRATYPVSSKLNATYWLVNGANQTEDFNGFKSQAVLLNFNPTPTITGNFNYYVGREYPTPQSGRFQVLDTYLTWSPNSKWTLAGEADYVVNRTTSSSAPDRVTGGAAYLRYRFNKRFSLASRYTLLNDKGGLFSGKTQNLRDLTLTSTFDLADGFQMRWEYRRDSSGRPYFATDRPNQLSRSQNTALLGLIWWFGGKQGAW